MRFAWAVVIVASCAVPLGAQAQSDSGALAQRYNIRGMEFYRHRQYDSAAAWFRAALKEEPNHKLASYNLACALALRLSGDHWVWDIGDDPVQNPFDALARAIELDPGAARKAAHDPDFIHIRLTPRFQTLIGADLKDPNLIRLLLVANGEWFGPSCGSWCGNDLLFFETGEAQKRLYVQDERGRDITKSEAGQWSVADGVITIRFESGQVLDGRFTDDGVLQFGDSPENRYGLYLIHDI